MNGNGKTIGEAHPDTVILTEYICAKAVGAIITFEEMSEEISCNVREGAGRSRLSSARRRAQSMNGIVTGAVRRVGIKILAAGEIVKTARGGIGAIGRKARRARKALSCADYKELTAEEKISWNMGTILFRAFETASRETKLKQLEAGVRALPDPAKLSVGKALDIIKG